MKNNKNENAEFLTALGDWLTKKTVTPESRWKLISKYPFKGKDLTDPWDLGIDLLWILEHKVPETMEYLIYRVNDVLNDSCEIPISPRSKFDRISDQEEAEYLQAIGALLVSNSANREECDTALVKMPYHELDYMNKITELGETVNSRLKEIIFKLKHNNYAE